jgi:hypothetical protein
MKKLTLTIALLLSTPVFAAPAVLTDIPDSEVGTQPADTESFAHQLYDSRLKDSDSAKYKVGQPFKCYLRGAPITGGKIKEYGWCFDVSINSKNSFGAYTGYQTTHLIAKQLETGQWSVHEYNHNMWFNEPWLKE